MKRLKISSLYDSLHFLLFFVVLLILSLKYWYLFPILFIYIVFIIKKTELISFCLFLGILIIISSLQYIPVNKDELSFKGVIVEINDKSIVVKNMGRKYLIYCDEKLSIGDIAEVKIEKTNSKNELFDYNEYLLNNSIYLFLQEISKSMSDMFSEKKDDQFQETENMSEREKQLIKKMRESAAKLDKIKNGEKDTKDRLVKQIISLVAIGGYTYDQVYSMTIVQMIYLLKKYVAIQQYELYIALSPYRDSKNGQTIEHWLDT